MKDWLPIDPDSPTAPPDVDWQGVARENKDVADYWRGEAMRLAAEHAAAPQTEAGAPVMGPEPCKMRAGGVHVYACMTCGKHP